MQVCRGRTTNEVLTNRYHGRNPFGGVSPINCCRALFGTQYPSMLHRHRSHPSQRWHVTREDIRQMAAAQSPPPGRMRRQGGGGGGVGVGRWETSEHKGPFWVESGSIPGAPGNEQQPEVAKQAMDSYTLCQQPNLEAQ